MKETFRPIKHFPGYSVSSYGRVRNDRYSKILTVFRNPTNGWYFVTLSRNGDKTTRSVQGLVAEAFMDPPIEPNTSLLHLDGDRLNNAVDNLRWKPRWFVIAYMREINDPQYHVPIEIWSERSNGPVFTSIAQAASVLMQIPSVLTERLFSPNQTFFGDYGLLATKENFLSYARIKHSL